MIKKVLISAAGRGTRMLDLSKDKPKHLIEINGKPFLYYLLKNLKEAGFEEIIMVVGYKKEFMEEFLAEYGGEFNITLVNQFDILGEDRYGTACPLECVKDMLVVIGDVTLGSTAQGLVDSGIMGIVGLAPQDRIALVALLITQMLIQQKRFHALPAGT